MIEEIATADRERLKAYSDHLIGQLALQYTPNPNIEALRQVLARYEILLITEPALFAARITSEKGVDCGQAR